MAVYLETNTQTGRKLALTVYEESTSIENNTSTIYWKLESTAGQYNYYSIFQWSLTIAGQTIYPLTTTKYTNHVWPCTAGSNEGRITVGHKTDGSADAISVKLTGVVYTADEYREYTGSLPLSTIPRASTPSMGTATTNSAITINTNRASDSFTHTLTYSFGNASGTIGTNVGASKSWTPPRSLAQQIPNSTTGTGTLTCATYSGSNYVGSKSINFTLNVDSGVIPSISSSSVTDSNDVVLGKNWGTMLIGLSHLKVNISGSGNQGSTISKYCIEYEGQEYKDDTVAKLNTQLENLPLTIGSRTCKMWVTDSRGRASSKVTKTYLVTDYSLPSITNYNVERCTQNGTLDDDGTYLKVVLVGSASPVEVNNTNKNKFTAKIRYKQKGASGNPTVVAYVNESSSIFAVNYIDSTAKISGNGNISTSNSYEITFVISDSLSSVERSKDLSTGFDLVHYNKSGKSIAFGKKSEAGPNDEIAEFGLDVDFKGDIYIDGQAFAAGDTLPYGAIVEYDGDTVPDGYIKELDDDEVYSTNEKKIGYWIDNKPLYRKVINLGNLPNAGEKNVQIGVSNINKIISIRGIAISSSATVPLPYFYPNTSYVQYGMGIEVHGNNIMISSGTDRSGYIGYAILEYTKTTD